MKRRRTGRQRGMRPVVWMGHCPRNREEPLHTGASLEVAEAQHEYLMAIPPAQSAEDVTHAMPGTPEKITAMRRRLMAGFESRGLSLCMAGDAEARE